MRSSGVRPKGLDGVPTPAWVGWLRLALILAGSTHVLAEERPAPAFTADYSVALSGLPLGSMTRTLSYPTPKEYRMSSASRATGLARLFRNEQITEVSTGLVEQGRLRPDQYHYTRTGEKPKQITLSFAWALHTLRIEIDDEAWKLDLPGDAVDRLVYQVLAMGDLARGVRDPRYLVADGGKLKVYQFRTTGEERLKLGAGEYTTLRLEREYDRQDRATRIWLAPALQFIPVRVDVVDDDRTTRVELEHVKFQP